MTQCFVGQVHVRSMNACTIQSFEVSLVPSLGGKIKKNPITGSWWRAHLNINSHEEQETVSYKEQDT
jgi:hypothetical protein